MINKAKVFVTRAIHPEAISKLKEFAEPEIWPLETPPPHATLIEASSKVDALLCMLTDPIDQAVIDAGSTHLKVISQMAVGVDNIDVQYATAQQIPVGHTPNVLTESCADFTWSLMTAIARRVPESNREVMQGIWRPWGPDVLLGADLFQSTLGIIGLGRIGLAVAKRAIGFQMKVLYYSQSRKPELESKYGFEYAALESLLQCSDFVSIHTSLNASTENLINATTLKFMKPSAFLINIARGKIVHSQALTEAILNQKIAGAALDVFEPEPIPADHPLVKCKNVLLTPHIASASAPIRKKMALMCVENIRAALINETIPYCYNPQVYNHLPHAAPQEVE
jgi:glyoxylate reductase